MSHKTKMGSKRKSSRQKETKISPSSDKTKSAPEAEANCYQVAPSQVFYYLKEKAVSRTDISIKQVRETLARRLEIYDESKREFESDLRSLRIEAESYGSKLIGRLSREIKGHVSKLVSMARKYGDGEFKQFNDVTDSFRNLLYKFEESLFEERRNAGKFAKPQTNSCSYFVDQELYNKFKADSYGVNVEFVASKQVVIPYDLVNFGTLEFDGRPSDSFTLDESLNDGLDLSDDSDDSIIVETAKKRFYRKKRRRERRSDGEESADEALQPSVKNLRTASPVVPVVVSLTNHLFRDLRQY
jgi:hypothetical protein